MKLLIAAVTSLSLFAGAVTPAFADHPFPDRPFPFADRPFADPRDNDRQEWRRDHDRDHHDRHESRRDNHDRQYDRQYDRWDRRDRGPRFDERDYRTGYIDGRYDQHRFPAPRYIPPRGYYARSWHRGDRLPEAYCSSRYIVSDYDSYRLYAPPRGHRWVRVDDDVLLTAVATGAVVAVVSGLFH